MAVANTEAYAYGVSHEPEGIAEIQAVEGRDNVVVPYRAAEAG